MKSLVSVIPTLAPHPNIKVNIRVYIFWGRKYMFMCLIFSTAQATGMSWMVPLPLEDGRVQSMVLFSAVMHLST